MSLSEEEYLLQLYTVIATATMIAVIGSICKQKKILGKGQRSHRGYLSGRTPNHQIGREIAGRRFRECYFLDEAVYN